MEGESEANATEAKNRQMKGAVNFMCRICTEASVNSKDFPAMLW